MFASGCNYNKLKANLQLAIQRLKLLEKKKTEMAIKSRREIADYLAANKPDRARIRVEHIIREENTVEAMELLEMFCDLLVARAGLMKAQAGVDPGLEEAVTSLIWASPRLEAEVQELKVIAEQLRMKYGREYFEAAACNSLQKVNPKLLKKMSVEAPERKIVELYLVEIARSFSVPFTPDSTVLAAPSAPIVLDDGCVVPGVPGGMPVGAPMQPAQPTHQMPLMPHMQPMQPMPPLPPLPPTQQPFPGQYSNNVPYDPHAATPGGGNGGASQGHPQFPAGIPPSHGNDSNRGGVPTQYPNGYPGSASAPADMSLPPPYQHNEKQFPPGYGSQASGTSKPPLPTDAVTPNVYPSPNNAAVGGGSVDFDFAGLPSVPSGPPEGTGNAPSNNNNAASGQQPPADDSSTSLDDLERRFDDLRRKK